MLPREGWISVVVVAADIAYTGPGHTRERVVELMGMFGLVVEPMDMFGLVVELMGRFVACSPRTGWLDLETMPYQSARDQPHNCYKNVVPEERKCRTRGRYALLVVT